jgi:hypothetical protein
VAGRSGWSNTAYVIGASKKFAIKNRSPCRGRR